MNITAAIFDSLPVEDTADVDAVSHNAAEGAGIGASVGGLLGGLVALLAAIFSSVAVPGLGTLMAGPLTLALLGVSAGAANGSLVGALIGWGIPQESGDQGLD